MKKHSVILFILALIILSCSNAIDKNKKDETSSLRFEISLKYSEDDDIKVTFNKIHLSDKKQQSFFEISQKITRSDNNKLHEFVMFGDNTVESLRVNFGNKKQKTIIIDKAKITYKDKVITIFGDDFFRYFTPNIYASFDSLNKSHLITKKVSGRHVPNLNLKKIYINKLFDINSENF